MRCQSYLPLRSFGPSPIVPGLAYPLLRLSAWSASISLAGSMTYYDLCCPLRPDQCPLRFPQFQSRNVAQASLGKFDRFPRIPAESTALAFDGYGLRDQSPARPARDASHSVSVRQVAVLLHTSFRHRLAVMPLCFAKPSPPSR